jgi:hypothetical protein
MLESTLFPVTEVPIQMEGIVNPEAYKFIVRSDTSKIISCMTNEYKLVTNESIIETATPILKDCGAKLTECKTFSNGARTMWTWTIPDVSVDIGNGDMVNPTITLKNSYDGSLQLHILAGAFRILCSNGLVIGTTISDKMNKHSIYNMNLDKLENSIKDTIDTVENVFINDFPVLTETEIKPKYIKQLIEMFPSFTMEYLTQYLLANNPKTFWDLLNAATWVSTHNMKRNYETTHKLESRIYPKITKWANEVASS